MSDSTDNNLDKMSSDLRKQLLGLEALERKLDSFFGGMEPPEGAVERLLGQLAGPVAFSEADLMLDGGAEDISPINFEQAVARMRQDETDDSAGDLRAAGLEEEPVQPDESDEGKEEDNGGL